MKNVKLSQKLTESGLMLALSTILSLIAIAKLPYGGEITFASMLPMIIIAYRYGFAWGVLTGATYGLIQMLLGLNNLTYATSAAAVIAIIVLDYLFAFASVSLAAIFRRVKGQRSGLAYAVIAVCAARYLFHVISGCTVWAGLSIPTADALLYSLVYNATYMLPEMIVTCVAAVFLASSLDFRKGSLTALREKKIPRPVVAMTAISGLLIVGAVTAIVAFVFPKLQNPETGEFDIAGIGSVDYVPLLIIVAAVAVAAVTMYAVSKNVVKKLEEA